MQREQWSGLEKTKKRRRKRKKQTCSLAVLPVAVDGVAVADRGADWLVVLLSFSAFPFCFFSVLLYSSSCSLFYSLSLSGPLKRPLELLPEDEDEVEGDQCSDRATFLSFLLLLFSFLILLFVQFLFALFFFFVVSGFWNDEDDGNAGSGLNDFLSLHSFLLLISVSLSCYSPLSLLSCWLSLLVSSFFFFLSVSPLAFYSERMHAFRDLLQEGCNSRSVSWWRRISAVRHAPLIEAAPPLTSSLPFTVETVKKVMNSCQGNGTVLKFKMNISDLVIGCFALL